VYGAFLTALEPNYAAWPDDATNNSGIMEVFPNLHVTDPAGRGSLGSTEQTLVAMQAGTWTALNNQNGLAYYMTFASTTKQAYDQHQEGGCQHRRRPRRQDSLHDHQPQQCIHC
jgi:hypothetical protein